MRLGLVKTSTLFGEYTFTTIVNFYNNCQFLQQLSTFTHDFIEFLNSYLVILALSPFFF